MARRKPTARKRPKQLSAQADLDLAVVQSLRMLTEGDDRGFGDVSHPPQEVANWLSDAPPAKVRGLLLASLQRWHEIRKCA